jgi:hypothetical protein
MVGEVTGAMMVFLNVEGEIVVTESTSALY